MHPAPLAVLAAAGALTAALTGAAPAQAAAAPVQTATAPVQAAAAPVQAAAAPVQAAETMQPAGSPDGVAVAPAVTARLSSTPTVQYGLDIASYQHPYGAAIDWRAVAASGQSFVVVKATENGYVNPYLGGDVAGAHAAGMVVGAYAYARPAADAVAQADAFARAIGRLPAPALPPVLDLEDSGGRSPADLQAWTRTFLQRLQAASGVVPMIYTGPYFWSTAMGGSTAFGQYPLWEAHYTTASAPQSVPGWPAYSMWQFTDRASVPGISAAVDQDRFPGTRAQLEALARPVLPSTAAAPAHLPAGSVLASPSGQYTALLQGDGNLVVYGNGRALWSSGTSGHGGAALEVQADGNAVLYAGGRALWSTRTPGTGPGRLVMQDDGNLVLVAPRGAVWWTGLAGTDLLTPGGSLRAGQGLVSRNRRSVAVMQSDGNLVVYSGGAARWASRTSSFQATLVLQGDGNLVMYDYRGGAVWTSRTPGTRAGALLLQDDGNLVLYGPGGAVFATGA